MLYLKSLYSMKESLRCIRFFLAVSLVPCLLFCGQSNFVLSTDPADGESSASVKKEITAVFRREVSPSETNFVLTRAGQGIAGHVTYSGRTATFTSEEELAYDTRYTASLQSSGGGDLNYKWSFTTEPLDVDNIVPSGDKFVVYGDSRSNHYAHQRIVDVILSFSPRAVFHTGDLVEDGEEASQWERFNSITSRLRAAAEFYPALGNHEKGARLYFDNFSLPGNERWYSVSYPGLLFIILDSGVNLEPGSEQYLWLEKELKTANPSKFKVAVFHNPPFSTGPHGGEERLRNSIVPLFEKYGVDIVFTGHDHDYERSFYNGIYYIVTGGGGAPMRRQDGDSQYSEKFLCALHFCEIIPSGDELIVTVYDSSLKVIDAFKVSGIYEPMKE